MPALPSAWCCRPCSRRRASPAASGAAFLLAQLLDVTLFNWLRRQSWWRAPFVASAVGSIVDTATFFGIAFIGTGLPWLTWAAGDLAVKLAFALFCLAPYRLLMDRHRAGLGTVGCSVGAGSTSAAGGFTGR